MFQSTHPHGVRLAFLPSLMGGGGFNPRTHTGYDTPPEETGKIPHLFQSTHPHGVRPTTQKIPGVQSQVSIHAPTRGTTIRQRCQDRQHRRFNPRTHTGYDYAAYPVRLLSDHVSIHAPTRGTTYQDIFFLFPYMFQSTHPHGVRPLTPLVTQVTPEFQSTHPHGVRLLSFAPLKPLMAFQSTHPHGVRRLVELLEILKRAVSIHAPTRGTTILSKYITKFTLCFNPRTHTGYDRIYYGFV